MKRIRECRAEGGVMYCKSPRCPERIAFFADLEVHAHAKDAADHITTVQAVMREQGFKAERVAGVDDIIPGMRTTSQVWSKADMARLNAMIGDGNHIDGEIQDVPISAVQTTRQSLVKFAALHHYINNPDHTKLYGKGVYNDDSLPVVIRNGDQLAVVDGTHRFVTSVLLGKPTIRAVVADLI